MATIVPQRSVEIDLHGWHENRLRSLAREIAMDILELDDILRHHGVSTAEWARIERNKQFQAMYHSEVVVWNSALNTEERTKLKAQALLEMALLPAQAMINDKNEPASARVEMVKTIAKISGITEKVQAQGVPGERFVINIDMGAGKKLSVEHRLPEQVIEGTAIDVTDQ